MCSRINITFDHLQYIILFAFWSDKYCAKGRLYNSAMPNAALTHTSHTAPLSKWQNSNGNGQHTHTHNNNSDQTASTATTTIDRKHSNIKWTKMICFYFRQRHTICLAGPGQSNIPTGSPSPFIMSFFHSLSRLTNENVRCCLFLLLFYFSGLAFAWLFYLDLRTLERNQHPQQTQGTI